MYFLIETLFSQQFSVEIIIRRLSLGLLSFICVQVLNKHYGQVLWSNGFEPLLKVDYLQIDLLFS
jgi:hypothetical protein